MSPVLCLFIGWCMLAVSLNTALADAIFNFQFTDKTKLALALMMFGGLFIQMISFIRYVVGDS